MAGRFPIHIMPPSSSGAVCSGRSASTAYRGGVKRSQSVTGQSEMRSQRNSFINRLAAVGGPPPMKLPVAHDGLTAEQEQSITQEIQKEIYMIKNAHSIRDRKEAKERLDALIKEKAGTHNEPGGMSEDPSHDQKINKDKKEIESEKLRELKEKYDLDVKSLTENVPTPTIVDDLVRKQWEAAKKRAADKEKEREGFVTRRKERNKKKKKPYNPGFITGPTPSIPETGVVPWEWKWVPGTSGYGTGHWVKGPQKGNSKRRG